MRLTLLILCLGLFSGCASVEKSVINTAEEYGYDAYDALFSQEQIDANKTSYYTIAGIGLFLVGSIVLVTVSQSAGLKLIACSAVAGAVPYLVQFEYFYWILAGTLAITAGLFLWHLWWRIRKSEDANDAEKK